MEPNVEELMDKLETYLISCENIVTYKWISQEWNVHVNTAKQLLFSFVNKQRSREPPVILDVTYFLSGCLKDCNDGKSQQVSLVREKDIPVMKSKFKNVHSEHIYSISKSLKDLHEIYIVDQVHGGDVKDKTKTAAIKCELASPRRIEALAKASMNTTLPAQNCAKVHNGATDNNKKEVDTNKSGNLSSQGNGEKTINTNKKPTGNKNPLANLFAKQASRPSAQKAKKVEPPKKMPVEVDKTEDPFASEDEVDLRRAIFRSEPPVEGKQEKKKGRKKKKRSGGSAGEEESPLPTKKRRRIRMMSSSEGSSEEEMEIGESESPLPETPKPSAKDVVISDDDDIIPATPSESVSLDPKRRRKKRTQVSRTYTDEKGFIVTKKEYVFVSCSDDSSQSGDDKKTKESKSNGNFNHSNEITSFSEASKEKKTKKASPNDQKEIVSPEGKDAETKGKKNRETEKGKKNGKFPLPNARQGVLTNFFKRS